MKRISLLVIRASLQVSGETHITTSDTCVPTNGCGETHSLLVIRRVSLKVKVKCVVIMCSYMCTFK